MKITHDTTADALYIEVSKKGIAQTVPVSDVLVVDMDSDGNAVGYEVLNVSAQKSLVESLRNSIAKGIQVVPAFA